MINRSAVVLRHAQPFIDWVAVCTIPIPYCEWVDEAIDWFGSCDCTPGHW